MPGFTRCLDKNGSLLTLHPLRNVLMLPPGLIPACSRQLAEGCSRLSDKNPNWKAQGLWLVIFLFRPGSKHKC